ncbi:arsenite efflux transporter metallochaperone ArsD [Williamsia sp. 1135]|uniref:arsenite efflux transporter metallochaperone ArsD n=1 Tax=Williamsia sp. 1135 TaxID=1889262 RepID=UPI000A10A364|nr:arsenite efflux transporter metallochaperone ArsD [Williamsia sp. 1135]ORM37247.1 arsenical resistance operon transcriptional repressor ArsD [Williamsia sp. 1135]
MSIEIFEPALCCATGVCGDDVDQALITFSADIDWLRSQGADITRFNLASEPMAFAEREPVTAFLQLTGSQGLPLALVNGVTAMTGTYPTRSQLATWAGLPAPEAAAPTAGLLTLTDTSSCCSTNSDAESGCC